MILTAKVLITIGIVLVGCMFIWLLAMISAWREMDDEYRTSVRQERKAQGEK